MRIPGLIRQLKVQKFMWPLSCTGGPVSVIPCGRPDAQEGGMKRTSHGKGTAGKGSQIARFIARYVKLHMGLLGHNKYVWTCILMHDASIAAV